ncbi:alpha-L-rhamnosidase [Amycolatopsis balhimycina DSM 5908]|uniref:alpha-L-rhamnosidase n=1 Tax=Amycolatopsis balhimycina DSM 5908 TaxID=1081091 RepID=A0A428WMI5_AMYBA|nr:family 78 glycoside hydrolase catalytic domain [Amycolatopsis balhimycina]RSM44252.1 alpha-L-rhamnosidase [Amycolatopsis balhimycina DSM 5908]
MTAPTHLRVEHLENPLGTSLARPRLSWWLPAGATTQSAYHVRTGDWDSGRVDDDQHVLVRYTGPLPGSGERVTWQVKVWTDLGESAWSEPAFWESGLGTEDWTASWIEPSEQDVPEPGSRPAHLFRRDFTVPRAVSARLYVTAHGIYEAFLNGERVGDLELTPGFTAYRDVLHVQTYDVTDLLRAGENTIGATVSDGWFRGRTGAMRLADSFGNRTALLCQLHLRHEDGSTTVLVTDATWTTTPAWFTADLMDGQTVDLRQAMPGWSAPGYADASWSKAVTGTGGLYDDFARLTASPAPPVRNIEELTPVSIAQLPSGRQVVDLGQNINGRLRVRVPSGDHLVLTHGEALGPDGNVTVEHLRGVDWQTREPLSAGQVDQVISGGQADEVFEPRHTTHGFRYVSVEGASQPLTAGDVRGVVVHTDLRRTGWFRCSDDRVNRLHEAAVWSFRDNACDIPTDCPQRERAGWTGDWMLYVPTAAFLYDVAGFSVKWLRDLAVDQWDDGCLTNFAPDPGGRQVQHLPAEILDQFAGSSGWGDASVIVPWELYLTYADLDVLAEFRPMMARWVDFAAERARTRRYPSRTAAPAPHEEFLWDGGFHWGEWCEPDVDEEAFRTADHGAVATAYLYRSASLLSRISTTTGHQPDAERYGQLAANALDAWRTEFIADDGSLTPAAQATSVRALAFGLVPEELRAVTADRLVTLIRDAGTHVGTGFLATPYLLPVLADTGHLDVAYELLFQDTSPSWLTMIDRGATTIWELWDGIDEHGTPHASLNHYSKGAVVSFLHRHTAGIQLREDAPGYRHFEVRPEPGGGLTWAEAEFDSVHGRITSSWRIEGGRFHLTVTVPPGATATVTLPDGHGFTAGPGTHVDSCEV